MSDTGNPAFRAGQTWKYHTRAGEEASTLEVLGIESAVDGGEIALIAIKDLQVRTPSTPDGTPTDLNFIPIGGEALRRSVTEMLTARAPVPPYEEDHRRWRSVYDAGIVGVFTTPIAGVVADLETKIAHDEWVHLPSFEGAGCDANRDCARGEVCGIGIVRARPEQDGGHPSGLCHKACSFDWLTTWLACGSRGNCVKVDHIRFYGAEGICAYDK